MNETCDDGNVVDKDGCSKTCKIEANFTCAGSPSKCKTTLQASKPEENSFVKYALFGGIAIVVVIIVVILYSNSKKSGKPA
jgi:cysteine-rich repeat protein